MSKKKNKKVVADDSAQKNENHDHKEEQKQKQKQGGESGGGGGDGGGKKEGNGNAPVLFRIDLHCEGCASKVSKIVKGFEGVETVKIDGASGKCAVTGKFDPVKLRDKLELKTHKKVELLTPVPKKEKENTKSKDESADGKEGEKKEKDKSKDKISDDKKKNKKDEKDGKQLPVTSAMLKVHLHCEGCIQKIRKIVSKTKGYEDMKLDKQNDFVMVKGAMDMKALAETLKKHLKRDVEILQPKKDEKKEKEKEKKVKGGVDDNAAANGGGGGSNGGQVSVVDSRDAMEGNKMQFQQFNYGYGYPSPYPNMYAPIYTGGGIDPYYYPPFGYNAPQMFSDENPNACSIM